MNDDEIKRREDVKRILKRVDTDSTSFLTGAMESARDRANSHFTARDAAQEGATALWATRIGRALGLLFFAALVVNLFTGWFF